MTLRAKGHRILVKPDYEEVTKGGIVLAQSDRQGIAAVESGVVCDVGPTAWIAYDRYTPDGKMNPYWEPWCKVGDRIIYGKYGGKIVEDPETKVKYIVINDQDVLTVVEKKDE
jgi:co-chaperonin GroES (HSP10)